MCFFAMTLYEFALNFFRTTQLSETVRSCLRTCPVTPEYNPECGTNNITYDNPSRLFCAQSCGVSKYLCIFFVY